MVEPTVEAVRGTVLVVDDTADTLAVLTDALERAGYAALVATGGEAALAICARITPDLVLMDAVMPGLDGFASCRRLKASPALAHVPVIFMTALTETEHVVQGLAAGGVDYVTKPIVLDELFARIHVHLANARTAQSARLALDTAGSFLLAVDRAGAVLWATPQAGRLIGSAPSDGPPGWAGRLATAIAAGPSGTPVPVPAADGRTPLAFTFLGAAGRGEYLFQVGVQQAGEDALRERFALTGREADVLTWIARGKSNRDIGEILDLSPRTVNKHLEVVFRKLGVENRASAAVLASRLLNGR